MRSFTLRAAVVGAIALVAVAVFALRPRPAFACGAPPGSACPDTIPDVNGTVATKVQGSEHEETICREKAIPVTLVFPVPVTIVIRVSVEEQGTIATYMRADGHRVTIDCDRFR